MNKFKFLNGLLSLLLFLIIQSGLAQDQGQFDSWETQIEQTGFGGKFAVMPGSDMDYDYYLVDLTRLSTRFERIYFLNLAYKSDSIVNIDPDINDTMMWFKAYNQYKFSEIECLFDTYRDEANNAYKTFTEEERDAWLKTYDKYNSK
jgi:hypothetical protein